MFLSYYFIDGITEFSKMNIPCSGIFSTATFEHFFTSLRPLHGPSRPTIFHGPFNFFTATFEQRGRGDGHLATLPPI
jgi:hypothetical protein